MEVWREENRSTHCRSQCCYIESVTRKGRDKYLVIDDELRGPTAVLGNFLADCRNLSDIPPVEIERYENLHVIVGSGIVCQLELLVSIWVNADIKRKCINS